MDQPGIEIRPIVNIAGGHEFNEVFFSDARTPAHHVVGAVDQGWQVANQLLAFERGDDATVVALRLGGVEERLLEVARRRVRLGDPPVRQALARIHSEVDILRSSACGPSPSCWPARCPAPRARSTSCCGPSCTSA